MTRSLSQWQAIILGTVVLSCLGVGAWGMLQIGHKTGMFGETYEVVVYVPDAQDIDKGTIVRIRGVEAGKVVSVEFPEDETEEMVRLRLRLDAKFKERLFADAAASIASKGLLGSSFVAVNPGKAASGPLASNIIRSKPQADLAEVTAKLSTVAARVDHVLQEIELGEGTLGKLVRDDSLYNDIKLLTADARKLVNNTNDSVTSLRTEAQSTMYAAQKAIDNVNTGVNSGVNSVQSELAGFRDFLRTLKEAITAVKQDAEAIKSMPIVRNYITDEVKVMVKPNCTKDRVVYSVEDLFEPSQAVLTADGRKKIGEAAAWLRGHKEKGSEIVVASFADPKSKDETAASARELTRKQSEIVADLLKEFGAARMGTFSSSRNVTPIGLGMDPSPVVEKEELPTARTEIILFVPR